MHGATPQRVPQRCARSAAQLRIAPQCAALRCRSAAPALRGTYVVAQASCALFPCALSTANITPKHLHSTSTTRVQKTYSSPPWRAQRPREAETMLVEASAVKWTPKAIKVPAESTERGAVRRCRRRGRRGASRNRGGESPSTRGTLEARRSVVGDSSAAKWTPKAIKVPAESTERGAVHRCRRRGRRGVSRNRVGESPPTRKTLGARRSVLVVKAAPFDAQGYCAMPRTRCISS